MVSGVESSLASSHQGVVVRLFGPPTIARDGVPVVLPASRKLRALLAYLALAPHPVGRGKLCELLWDVPNDPRGELRWCLSKLRAALDEPGRRRIETSGDTIALDLDGISVDVLDVAAAAAAGIETLEPTRLQLLSDLFVGDFLEGLEIDRSPLFNSWLTAQRRRFGSCQAAILEHLVKTLPADSEDVSAHLEKWLELTPFDSSAHVALLVRLARRGQFRACEDHLAAAASLFQSEELDFGPVRQAWLAIRAERHCATLPAQPAVAPMAGHSPIALAATEAATPHKAALAVMPFAEDAGSGVRGGLADGLTHDIITRLAKLRDFFVIARGSVFALAERNIAPEDAGRRLNVDYVATGTVRSLTGRLIITVELVEVRTARIVWAETFERKPDDLFAVLDDIGNSIVARSHPRSRPSSATAPC